ncbi:MAG: hypothetical protein D6739_00120, partial [Nitrospirae bacterium]
WLLARLKPGAVVTVYGPGGMGKSALAAEVVHRLTPADRPPDAFPDGVLYYSFYGQPETGAALEQLAKSFDPGARAADARRLLPGRRALVVLDGAEEANDLRAVLDCLGQCGVLVTTRDRTPNGLPLERLSPEEAASLLQRWAGPMEEATAAAICQRVGYLPLAVELAGKFIAGGEPAADYLAWLETAPLDALHRTDARHRRDSLPLLLEKSLNRAGPEATAALAVAGLLALHPFPREAIEAALQGEARRPLDRLVRYGLLRRERDGLYALSHPLVHTWARQQLAPPPEALPRLADFYAGLAETEWQKGTAGYPALAAARPHILRLVEACREAGEWERLDRLVWAIEDYLDLQGYTTDRVTLLAAGVEAARRRGDRRNEGALLGNLGLAYAALGRVEEAIG